MLDLPYPAFTQMSEAGTGIFGTVPLLFLRAGYAKRIIAVYAALSSFQGKAADCFPSLAQIALRSGLRKDTVSKAIAILVQDGWLTCKRRGRSSNLYSLMSQKGEWAKLPIRLLQGGSLSKRDLVVYGVLSSFQGGKDHCFPARSQMAERAGIQDLGSISKSISKLKKQGWIESKQRSRESNLFSVNLYPLPLTRQGQDLGLGSALPFLPQRSAGLGAVSQCQSGQLEAVPQCQSEQLEAVPQCQSGQLEVASQCQSGQLEAVPQCQNGRVHSAVLSQTLIEKTTNKRSSTLSVQTNSTLGVHSAKVGNSKRFHSGRMDNSRQVKKIKTYEVRSEKNMNNQNGMRVIPENQEEPTPRSIHVELERYFKGNDSKNTIILRQTLFHKVLPLIFREVQAHIKKAIIAEEDGRLIMQRDFPFREQIQRYMGHWIKLESRKYNPEEHKSIRKYLEENLYKGMPSITKKSIEEAIFKEEDGFLYVDKLKIMPHHAKLLVNFLGQHLVFCNNERETKQRILFSY